MNLNTRNPESASPPRLLPVASSGLRHEGVVAMADCVLALIKIEAMADCVLDCGRVVNRRERRAGWDGRRDYVRATWYAVRHIERYGAWLAYRLDRAIVYGARA